MTKYNYKMTYRASNNDALKHIIITTTTQSGGAL